jgi:CheY-like chemotaxis protein
MKDYSKFSILMVDDVPLNLKVVSKMLTPFNFRIRMAGGGRESLEMIMQEKPDILLLDIMMPEIDGFEVLSRIKGNALYSDIRVIILSALNANQDIVRAYELGASDFITKPILMDKLINSLDVQITAVEKAREARQK